MDRHIPRGLEVITVYYSTQPAGDTYPDLVKYLKIEPDFAKQAHLVIHLLACVRSRVKHQIY